MNHKDGKLANKIMSKMSTFLFQIHGIKLSIEKQTVQSE